MKKILEKLLAGEFLEKQTARSILLEIGEGKQDPYQITVFLAIIEKRGIQSQELAGFQEAMQELSLKVDLSSYEAVDIVGTGGDYKNSFNISTATSLLVAASGVNVTKHGNYGISSICGSSSLLEYLGVKFSNELSWLKKMLDTSGFCMLHAPLFHPAMKFVAPIRKAIQIKTFFNLLGPMINPSSPKNQFLGVSSEQVFDLYSEVYQNSNINYIIVYSLDGYDEISLTSDIKINIGGQQKIMSVKDFGFSPVSNKQISGGNSIAESAKIFQAILKNEANEAQKNVVLVNAAMVLSMVKNITLTEGLTLAKETLESGKAFQALQKLIAL